MDGNSGIRTGVRYGAGAVPHTPWISGMEVFWRGGAAGDRADSPGTWRKTPDLRSVFQRPVPDFFPDGKF